MQAAVINENDATKIKSEFAAVLHNLTDTYSMLKSVSGSDSIEILFFDEKEHVLHDKIKGTKLETKYLDDDSILGRAFNKKKAQLVQNIASASVFNTAIDNPFKIGIAAQLVIPTVFEDKIEGVLRFSKSDTAYNETDLDRIRMIGSSFREIFLNERYLQDIEMQRHPFSLQTFEVYRMIKEMKAAYGKLLEHTENPEIEKLLREGQSNVEAIFQYLNPNHDNISRVKNELRQLNKNRPGRKGLKVLIADDVQMNVKILTSLLNSEASVGEILTAYDGNQTEELLQITHEEGAPIDIVFLDHHMPGKLGLEIAEKLKNNQDCKTLIVSITNDPDAIKNKLYLYDYQISKPFKKSALESIMQNIDANGRHRSSI